MSFTCPYCFLKKKKIVHAFSLPQSIDQSLFITQKPTADFWISEKGSKRKKNRGQGGGSNKGKIWENYRFYFFFFRPKVEFPESVSSRENPRRQSLNLRPEKRYTKALFISRGLLG
ncbi:uncharacterized protein LOC124891030 [Capsicum annuum]|uniref:uncharacterized protein LOC124891030 n=1 Tax=Capsicum annuum TaxID=4072 RepID=UPI001FB0B410|nr:uncharacterized protein LOC124891030 [Capsicum annuum]